MKSFPQFCLDVLDTPVSPELLPPEDGTISQKTEDLVGPYELHDFFLYYILRFGYEPAKTVPDCENCLCRHVRLRDNFEMDEDLLPEIFLPAVQTLLSARRPEGRFCGCFPKRRFENAQ